MTLSLIEDEDRNTEYIGVSPPCKDLPARDLLASYKVCLSFIVIYELEMYGIIV